MNTSQSEKLKAKKALLVTSWYEASGFKNRPSEIAQVAGLKYLNTMRYSEVAKEATQKKSF